MTKKIMFIFAHPDDESFACAGTIAKYRSLGHEISLVCATSGCKGKSGEYQFQCREELARHREKETKCAAEIMGISNLIFYRYPDGSLMSQDLKALGKRIYKTIHEIRPDILVTFPPDGVTGHPDHIAICQATNEALSMLDAEGGFWGDVYFASIPHYYDYCEQSGPANAYPITGKVDITPFREVKSKALQAHRSQIFSLNRAYPGIFDGEYYSIGNYEYYTLIRAKGEPIFPQGNPEEIGTIDFV